MGIKFEELVTDCVTAEVLQENKTKVEFADFPRHNSQVTDHAHAPYNVHAVFVPPKKVFTETSKAMKLFAMLHFLRTCMLWFALVHRLSIMCNCLVSALVIIIHLSISA